jgi:hypothetical protein
MIFLVIPYLLAIIGIPGLMTIPFYFFNKYLQQKINPRKSGRHLLLYFITLIATLFVYISIGVLLIIAIARLLK